MRIKLFKLLMNQDAGGGMGGVSGQPQTGFDISGGVGDNVSGQPNDNAPQSGVTGGSQEQGDAAPAQQTGGQQQPRVYTEEEVSRIVSTRLNEDRSRKILERIARQTGLSIDKLEAELDRVEKQAEAQRIQQAAQQVGVDPRLLHMMRETYSEVNRLKMENQINSMRSNPKDFPGFSQIENDVIDKANQLGIPLTDAYYIVAGQRGIQQAAREAEHRMITNRQNWVGKDMVTGDSHSSVGEGQSKIPDEIKIMAAKVGMDPEEYQALMEADNIDVYRAYKSKKTKK